MNEMKIALLQAELSYWKGILQDMIEVDDGKRKYWKLNNDLCKVAADLQGLDMSNRLQRLKIRIKPKCDLCKTLRTEDRCDYIQEIMYRIHDGSNIDDTYEYYSQKFKDLIVSYIEDVEKDLLKIK